MHGHLQTCFQLEIYSNHDKTWVNGENIYIYFFILHYIYWDVLTSYIQQYIQFSKCILK